MSSVAPSPGGSFSTAMSSVTSTVQGVVSGGDLLEVFLRTDEDIASDVRGIVMVDLLPETADGIVTVNGLLADRSLVPVVARMVRSVEGVVDVRCALTSSRV
ncbi:hypothetical protein ABZ461_24190 [Actinacidiphila glaucinigra]|uniref:hypothetical protein n=1 Tax=Actinacidiphila glaucinigra TaxID=235986 RepID=UPI0033E2A9F2